MPYSPMEWNLDDSLLAIALENGSVVLVNPKSGEASQPILEFAQAASQVEWSGDGETLLGNNST